MLFKAIIQVNGKVASCTVFRIPESEKKYFSFLLKIAAWELLSFSKTSCLPRTKAAVGKICGNSSAAFLLKIILQIFQMS